LEKKYLGKSRATGAVNQKVHKKLLHPEKQERKEKTTEMTYWIDHWGIKDDGRPRPKNVFLATGDGGYLEAEVRNKKGRGREKVRKRQQKAKKSLGPPDLKVSASGRTRRTTLLSPTAIKIV